MTDETANQAQNDTIDTSLERLPASRLGMASLCVFVLAVLIMVWAIVDFTWFSIRLGDSSGASGPSRFHALRLVLELVAPPITATVGLGLGLSGVASRDRRRLLPALGIVLNGGIVLAVLVATVLTWIAIVSFFASFSQGM